jgi:hypothetical protein
VTPTKDLGGKLKKPIHENPTTFVAIIIIHLLSARAHSSTNHEK